MHSDEGESRLEQSTGSFQVPAGAVRGENFCWVRGELIGRGSLGYVHKALEARTGKLMAVKEVLLDSQDQTDEKFRKSLQNEVDLLKEIQHPRIVAYLGHDYTEGRLYIYLEYMPGNSIAQVLSQFGPLDECLISRYTHNLLEGLEYLHTRDPPVLHRDIKGANILVGIDRTVKLSDFGCSKRSLGTAVHTLRGSIPWMAPEVMKQQDGYGRKADIWSLGCVMIEMALAEAPWGTFDNCLAAMVRIAMSEETPPVPSHLSALYQDFVVACTRRAPQDRPDATDLLKQDFVAGSNRSSIDESWG
jgi:serine/threonine protein kinase